MNSKLLIGHKINLPLPINTNSSYVKFINFIHPNFDIIDNLSMYDNPHPNGIIFVGKYNDKIIEQLNTLTSNWIIVTSNNYDLDLSTNEGLIKHLLPLHYIKSKKSSSKDETPVYENMNYDDLLEKIKICLLDNSELKNDKFSDSNVYQLYLAILDSPNNLYNVFFSVVNYDNINLVTSSILTFLSKVQSQNTYNASLSYARLLQQSNRRYGKRIKQGVTDYLRSHADKVISLFNLLCYLNKT